METVPFSETIDRAKAGNKEALTELYNSFKPHISSYVHAYVNLPYVADDIVSDVFTSLMQNIHTFRSNDTKALYSYLRIAADTKIANYYRTSTVKRTDPLDNSTYSIPREVPLDHKNPKHDPISWDDPALSVEIAERDTIIHGAIKKLSTDAHKVIVGRIVHGLPFREIASMAGKSDAAARKIYERTLGTLRRALTTLLIAGLMIAGTFLYFNWEGNSASRYIGYPVNQPSHHSDVTPTATPITIPSQLLIPTPTPSPTPTATPVPTPIATQQATSQPASVAQDLSLPVHFCVLGECSH